jgi:ferredoxin
METLLPEDAGSEEHEMTILYFTATGNGLYIAGSIGGTLLSIPKMIHDGQYRFEDDRIGVILPVYGWAPAPFVLDYLKKCELKTDYLFAVLSYGCFSGDAAHLLKQFGKRNGKDFAYIASVRMTDNYLPLFSMKHQKQTEERKKIDEHLLRIRSEIASGLRKDPLISPAAPVSLLLSSGRAFSQGRGSAAWFRTDRNCIGCGVCTKVCPTGNIALQKGRPVFSASCVSCLACIQNCPQGAIHMPLEHGPERYRNRHIGLDRIIASNRQDGSD